MGVENRQVVAKAKYAKNHSELRQAIEKWGGRTS